MPSAGVMAAEVIDIDSFCSHSDPKVPFHLSCHGGRPRRGPPWEGGGRFSE